MSALRILGLDPGLGLTGYGVLDVSPTGGMTVVAYGVVRTPARRPLPERLLHLYRELQALLALHRPQQGAVEQLFFQRNVSTAIAVGQARGVALLALAEAGLTVAEYPPNVVKETVTGYGQADKGQMQRMVQTLLRLPEPPRPDDAADALAVALCHAQHARFAAHLPDA